MGKNVVQLYDKDGNPAYPRPYYRIGDILESTNPNNPTDDGYIGTWELYGKGRVTVCIDSDNVEFNTINKEIGEREHTLTVDEMPSHSHLIASSSGGDTSFPAWNAVTPNTTGSSTGNYYGVSTLSAGNTKKHNNIQPSIVVYRWRRIA